MPECAGLSANPSTAVVAHSMSYRSHILASVGNCSLQPGPKRPFTGSDDGTRRMGAGHGHSDRHQRNLWPDRCATRGHYRACVRGPARAAGSRALQAPHAGDPRRRTAGRHLQKPGRSCRPRHTSQPGQASRCRDHCDFPLASGVGSSALRTDDRRRALSGCCVVAGGSGGNWGVLGWPTGSMVTTCWRNCADASSAGLPAFDADVIGIPKCARSMFSSRWRSSAGA